MSAAHDRWESLGLVISIVALPIGLLSAMFVSFQAAAVVFIVGWFLLTPLLLVFGDALVPSIGSGRRDESESATAERGISDPRDELKQRYVRGEIDDEEFERRMQKRVEADHDDSVRAWTGDADAESVEADFEEPVGPRDRERSAV